MVAFYFIFAVNLLDKKLAVTEDGKVCNAKFFCRLQSLDKGGIFSNVVCGVA